MAWHLSEKWQELKTLRDELKLQFHLMEKELGDELHSLLKRIVPLEKALVSAGEALGKAEEHLLVGSDEEIAQLVDDLRELQKQHQSK